ncbi:MAG TPA: WbqC family protein, partial [Paludibacteraceae bacterium]|nr:WbqC family protein [Paludibacteraceae bacterium]
MEKLDGRGFLKMQHDKDTFDFSLKKIQYKNQAKILSQWKSENSMPAILSLAYLAPVEYYKVLANSSEIFIEKEENYIKQTYRNRCKILTANGVMDLIIPVEKSEGNKPSIKDVKISVHSDWQKQHWRAT